MSHADRYLEHHDPSQSGLSWQGPSIAWTPDQYDGLIRAIAEDLAAWGSPWAVVEQGLFLLAAHFHDQHPVATGRAKVTWSLRAGDEEFDLRIERLLPHRLPPIPGANGAGAHALQERPWSRLIASSARSPASFTVVDDRELLGRLRETMATTWPQLPARSAAQAAGAVLAIWQGLQSCAIVAGGALFRRLRHPDAPETTEGQVRLVFERRTPDHLAALTRDPDGGAFLLNM